MSIRYSPQTGNYWDDATGRFVPKSRIQEFVDSEVSVLESRLEELARAAAKNEISPADFSRLSREAMRPAMARMAMLGAGGQSQLSDRQLGTLGSQAKLAYGSLRKLTLQARNGDLTEAQFVARARALAGNVSQAFYRAEQLNRAENGVAEGWRKLGGNSNHCQECLGYATGGWVPITEIVPVGVACRCGGNCLCSIQYRRGGGGDISQLSNAVMRRQIEALPADAPTV